MENITYATPADVREIKALMDGAIEPAAQKDWYVVEEIDFIEQHIEKEGYTLKIMIDGAIATFLMVRHPGDAEDNLAYDLIKTSDFKEREMPETELLRCEFSMRKSDGLSERGFELLDRVSHMESAVVAPAHRGKGLQEKLLKKAEEIERERGAKYLLATVHPDNVFSLNNLLKQGFDCVLETEKYGGLRRKVLCKRL